MQGQEQREETELKKVTVWGWIESSVFLNELPKK